MIEENDVLEVSEGTNTQEPETVAETVEIVEVEADRPFLTTPIDDYTVTEGLLLIIALILVVKWIGQSIKEGFYWLW